MPPDLQMEHERLHVNEYPSGRGIPTVHPRPVTSQPRETNALTTARSTSFTGGLDQQGEQRVQFQERLLDLRKGHEVQAQDAFRGLMRLRGIEAGAPSGHAEAFHCRTLVL